MSKQVAPEGKTTPAVKSAPAKSAAKPAAKAAPAKSAPVKKAGVADAIVAALTKKPAPAPAAKDKAAAPVKPAAKTVEKPTQVALVTTRATKGQTIHVIAETARPGSGKALRAHTHAALTALGMLQPSRPAAPKSAVLTMMGQRAVTYHTGEGNFEDAPDHGLRLTADGYAKFTERAQKSLDAKMANSFLGLFLGGKTDGTGVSVGNLYTAKF